MRPIGIALAAALLCASTLGVGCASSGKSKPRPKPTVLYTSGDDTRVGREAAESVVQQMGVLEDPALNEYVQGIGRKLLRGLPNRAFKYEFYVVDQVEPNAFALPGGYIFISRGLLALANDEDELACVIGHEITHAHMRHSASQQALMKYGNPLAMPWNAAARMSSYGRDMEREADRGGQLLAAAAGYNPMGMSTFLESLGQRERLIIGHARRKTFYDSHPGADERAAATAARSMEIRWKRDPAIGDPRESLLTHVDGIALGDRPEAGVFQGTRFIHPDLDFQMRFPTGWATSNSNAAVGAMAPRGEAAISLSADLPPGHPKEVGEGFVAKISEQAKVAVVASQPVKVGRIDAWRMEIEARGGYTVSGLVTFIPYKGATWRVTGMAPKVLAKKYMGRILSASRSFRPLSPELRNSVVTTRLRTVRAYPGEDLATISRRSDNAWDVAATAISNGVFANHRFAGGELVKIAKMEPYVPKPELESAAP